MLIKTLQDLEKLPNNNDNMFNLFQTAFNDYGPFYFKTFIVPKEFEMRIDLICYDMYDTTEFIDFLLWFNDIINPFNITSGMRISFVSVDIITQFYAKKDNQQEVQDTLLNKGKVKRKDKNRDKFTQQKRRAIPPTLNESPNEQVKIEGDSIIIGGGIFNT